MKKLSENVRDKKQIWDSELQPWLLESTNFKDYASETRLLFPIATKIIEHADSMKKLKYSNPTEMLMDRLLKSQEEFDIFDLKIYLYAKEKAAHIMTFNTQAFQEINDPTFLNYFEDTKILQPEINFKVSADLDRALCHQVLESAIKQDFARESAMLTSLEKMRLPTTTEIDVTEFHDLFKRIIGECSGSTATNFKKTMENQI